MTNPLTLQEILLDADVTAGVLRVAERQGKEPGELASRLLRAKLSLLESTGQSVQDVLDTATRLRLAEDTLQAIVDAVVTIDRHGGVEYLNAAAEELTGWSLDEVRGSPVGSAIQLQSRDADWLTAHLVQTCLQEGSSADLEEDAVLLNRAGKQIPIEGVASPLRNESGNIVGAALVMRDVTLRKRAEAELTAQRRNLEVLVEKRTADLKALQEELLKKERLATLGHVTATVSHEIRNPLGTIKNTMHVLEQRVRGQVDGVEPLFLRVDRNIKRCTQIISELLDFAQVRPPHFLKVELDVWLGQVLDDLDIPATVVVDRDFHFGRVAEVDPDRLRRVVVNVYDNACQAMTEDQGLAERRLTVRTRALPGQVELCFADTGPGMTDEIRAQIFRELFSTKRFGVGLGLPIVRQIVEQHGGEVHVQSAQGAGTKVFIRLPVRTG